MITVFGTNNRDREDNRSVGTFRADIVQDAKFAPAQQGPGAKQASRKMDQPRFCVYSRFTNSLFPYHISG